ncbi:lytic transglycosylase domain-containing protein [Sulfurospirillum cavolei]|uniref:lytic transglycosylase domain-containing protein n=1 Tax=Sulfurospirillum cavolei TaxID=366522 RepID=UPI00069485FA|nr:lytic transglycosylase domain-containing protein [Sulfurospirillum cavolei]
MLYKFVLSLCFCLPLLASDPVTLAFFQDKPRSLAKDFYIYEYLQRPETTPQEAKALFGAVHTMNMRFFHLFAKKMDNPTYKKISKCVDLDVNALLKEDNECFNIGITLNKISALAKTQLPIILSKLSAKSTLIPIVKLMQSDDVYAEALKNPDAFLTLFNGSISAYKDGIFDQTSLDSAYLSALSNNPKFNAFAMSIVQNDKLDTLRESLLHFRPSLHVKSKTLFYLGLNALRYAQVDQAMLFFEQSIESASKQEEKDKALFWQYLASKNANALQRLAQSRDVNIYSLYAREALELPFPEIVSPVFEGSHPSFDVSDPFAWPRVMNRVYTMKSEEVQTLAQSFRYADTLPHYVYLMERVTHYAKNYYPIPYPEEISGYSTHRQALMLAIARQESRFIPSVVSTSYALGMMQFMPFVARDIAAKEKIEDFDIKAMFHPHIAYLFGNIHLNFLEKSLYHPLFVAYAYNGGIGFTKRHLLGGAFKEGAYEPFWSLETMQNEESREYGKKVLANYVVYRELLGESVSIKNLFETLLIPSVTDRFRN